MYYFHNTFNRCADKAVEIAGDGFWDSDEVAIEVSDLFLCLFVCLVGLFSQQLLLHCYMFELCYWRDTTAVQLLMCCLIV
jgi:hypothetical protein